MFSFTEDIRIFPQRLPNHQHLAALPLVLVCHRYRLVHGLYRKHIKVQVSGPVRKRLRQSPRQPNLEKLTTNQLNSSSSLPSYSKFLALLLPSSSVSLAFSSTILVLWPTITLNRPSTMPSWPTILPKRPTHLQKVRQLLHRLPTG